jgi:hypothetical protein
MSASDGTQTGHLKGSYTGERTDPAKHMVLLTASTSSTGIASGPCRAIWSASTGTISFADHAGSTIDNLPVKAFDNPFGISKLFSISGTTAIWAMY